MPAVDSSDNTGVFHYDERGFRLIPPNGSSWYAWAELQSTFGFKLDYLTTDEICLDLFFSTGASLRLTESLPGWLAFLQQFEARFPTIPPHWEWEVAHPPFATKLTLLFERTGRTLLQAEAAWYKT